MPRYMREQGWVEIEGYFIHATQKAVGITDSLAKAASRETQPTWLPASQCRLVSGEFKRGALLRLAIPEWLAEKNGLHALEHVDDPDEHPLIDEVG